MIKIWVALFMIVVSANQAIPITIYTDYGGFVYEYWAKANRTKEVKFNGFCASACTLFLIVENQCATRRARFGFHLAYSKAPNSDAMVLNHKVSQQMFEVYPDWVKSWIKAKGGLTRGLKIMPNDYILKHMKAC